MTCEETRLRVADELFGGARSDFDDELQQHLTACDSCRAEADAVRTTWLQMGRLPEPEPSRAVAGRFYAALHAWEQAEQTSQQASMKPEARGIWRWWPSRPVLQASISAACLAAGLFTGSMVAGKKAPASAASSGEIAQLRKEMSGMRQLVTLSLLQQQSASERLRGVTWSYRAEPDDVQVLSALLQAVNTDPSVDVRLAAVESLKNLGESPVARRGLEKALTKQESPLVQISIVDALVELQDKNAAPVLRALNSSAELDPNVRQRITLALPSLQ